MQKKGLGKGLGALISGQYRRPEGVPGSIGALVSPDPAAGEIVRRVAWSAIVPSPLQPRKTLREEHLMELVESIRQHGIIQPLIVREVNGKYELIAGERRWRACQRLQLDEIPLIVREASDQDVLEMALIENLQREDLNPIEESEAYVRLSREFGLKQEDIAQRVGKNRATVANSMRLVDLCPGVKSLVSNGQLSVGHAKVLLSLKDHDLQSAAAAEIIRKGFTVRATEQLVARQAAGTGTGSTPARTAAGAASPGRSISAEVGDLENRLRDKLSTRVAIHHTDKKGRIEIDYYGNEDLERILSLLGLSQPLEVL